MSFDPETGNLFVGDVGSSLWEEVNLVTAGGNYGWPFTEGTSVDSALIASQPPGFEWTAPVHAHLRGLGPTNGNCVIGGRVYRGGLIPELVGKYVFGDFVSGNIWALSLSDHTSTGLQWLAGDNGGVSAFGQDPRNGEILVAFLWSGKIKRLTYTHPAHATPLPNLLSETGIFTDLASLVPADGIVPYHINVSFWSDNAVKMRWFSVPDTNTTIEFRPEGNWSFPTGTFWVKHFEMELTNGLPDSRRRLETRVLIRNADGVYGLTYKWDAAGTNAVLLPPEGADEQLSINSGNGTFRTQTWHYPTRYECLVCHNSAAGHALGFKTRQLNCALESSVTNQIKTLSDTGYFAEPVTNLSLLRSYSSSTNETYPLRHRARSYLSVNCVQCHQPDTPLNPEGYYGWDARKRVPFADAKLLDGRVIKAHSPGESELMNRFAATGSFRMPPLATSINDTNAYNLLAEWINTMPLPPWTNLNVGTLISEGASSEQEGVFTVSSAEGSMGEDDDVFQFLNQTLAGNGQIIAKLISSDGAMPGATAGIMIRDSSASNAAYAFIGVSNGVAMLQSRSANGDSARGSIIPGISIPQWLRLVRNQNQFHGFTSVDGTNWASAGTMETVLSGTASAGMAVAGGLSSKFHNARFNAVSLLSVNWITPLSGSAFDLPGVLSLAVQVNHYGRAVEKVKFFVDGNFVGEAFAEPYAATWTNTVAGRHSLVARAFDEAGDSVDSPTLLVTANRPASSAFFYEVNATNRGNWQGVRGTEGYAIAENETSLPASFGISFSNQTSVLWANNPTNEAALLKANSTERIAAAWTAQTNLSVGVNLMDGVRRELAFYFLDWATTNQQILTINVSDAITGTVLDARTLINFSSGKYLIWAVQGAVRFEISSVGLNGSVLSGVFVDPNSNPGPTIEITSPLTGRTGVAPANLPVTVNAQPGGFGIAQVDLLVNGLVVASRISPPYEFALTNLAVGSYELTARATDLLGDMNESQAINFAVGYPSAQATFLKVNSMTQGNWIGQYGANGHVLFGLLTNWPPAANISLADSQVFVRNNFSSFPGALQRPEEPPWGIEAEWVDPLRLSINLGFADGREHLCAFYVSDWGGSYRESSVEIREAQTGALLDTQVLSNFTHGKYYVWRIRGQVLIRLNRVLGGNVGLSGIFFDADPSPFQIWRALHFGLVELADDLVSGNNADPDGDGLSNSSEFAMGLNPFAFDTPSYGLTDMHLSLGYSRSEEASDWTFAPEYSTNLFDWNSGPAWVEPFSTNLNGNLQTIWVRSVRTIHEERGYLRLRITPP